MYSTGNNNTPWSGIPPTASYRNATGDAGPQAPASKYPHQQTHTEPSSERGPPTKRRRAALACCSCRARKSRCDGVRPRCSMCEELGFDCRYQQSSAYPNVIIGKEYLSSIEDRLKIVEERLFSNGILTPPASSGPEKPAPPAPTPEQNKDQSSRAEGPVETACVTDDTENSTGPEDSMDGMGAVTFAPEEDCAFFGPSSNIALLRDISRAVARIGHTAKPWAPSPVAERAGMSRGLAASTPVQASRPLSPSSLRYSFSDPYNTDTGVVDHQKINIYALPPEHLARELIRRYFSNTGQLFPYIHEQTFVEKYNQVKRDNFRGVRRMWLGLLNIVFAMATNVSLSPDGQMASAVKRTAESDVYYRRASGLCSEQIALGKGMSLEAVQYLLLMGQYLQGTQKSVQAWITHGLAIKVALQLGLHSSEASKGYPPLEQEIRKRTWYGCIVLDRTLSMTFGRPPTIPESQVKLDLPVSYSSLTPGSTGNGLEAMNVVFFNSTITLYRVMSSIIDVLYEQNLGCGVSTNAVETVARVFKLENDLVDWQHTTCQPALVTANDLPSAIMQAEAATFATPSDKEDDDSIPPAWWPMYELRLRTIITLRYNNLRILLHRPVLASLLTRIENKESSSNDVSIIQQVGSSSAQICSRSAKEVISIVSAVVHSKGPARGLLGAWWFSLYYTFNAALVIVAGVLISLRDNKDSSLTLMAYNQDAGQYLSRAIQALRNLDSDNRMVARCREYLEQLVQVLESRLSQYQSQVGNDSSVGLPNGQSTYFHPNHTANKQSPLGMELGEFLLDGDLNFLNEHMFAFGQDPASEL